MLPLQALDSFAISLDSYYFHHYSFNCWDQFVDQFRHRFETPSQSDFLVIVATHAEAELVKENRWVDYSMFPLWVQSEGGRHGTSSSLSVPRWVKKNNLFSLANRLMLFLLLWKKKYICMFYPGMFVFYGCHSQFQRAVIR